MASKYSKVTKDLSELPAEDTRYQERVDQVKKEIGKNTAPLLAEAYIDLRHGSGPPLLEAELESLVVRLGRSGIEDLLSRCNLQITALEQLLAESQENDEEGWGLYGAPPNAVRLPNGMTVSVQIEPIGKVIDKVRFRQWCIDNGYEGSLQLWPSTMNSIAKERLLNGHPDPDGVQTFKRRAIKLRKPGTSEDE